MLKIILAVFTLFFSISFLLANAKGQDIDSKIDHFAKTYQEAKSADQRRTLCIEAMDNGLLKKGDSIKVIDRMFHTNYANYFIGKDEDGGWAVIYFAPQHQDGYNQILAVGWYLAVKYDRDRVIQDYHLSNQNEK